MNPQLLYQEDSTTLEFDTSVIEILNLPGPRKGAVLERTYFYPTGGGQEHDTGLIGPARVVDVYKDEQNSRLVHVVEGELNIGPVSAHIDAERRLRHMQHHTAQHLLTQCILRQSGYETVSANINGYSPSTLDILATQISKSDLEQAELDANQIIYADKAVKTYIVTPEELGNIPLRRPPKVTENIRIVEIDQFDYSPCGGTHVLRTGSIGLVKVLKTERQNDRIRVFFIAGLQAMDLFRQMYDSFGNLANQMSTSWQELPALFSRQAEQLSAIQKEVQALRQAGIKAEANLLAAQAEPRGEIKFIRASFPGRPVPELRLLAETLKQMQGMVAFLSSYDGQKLSLVVACGEGSGKDARQLLTGQLSHINGRGGGDASIAQGGGVATEEQYRTFLGNIDID